MTLEENVVRYNKQFTTMCCTKNRLHSYLLNSIEARISWELNTRLNKVLFTTKRLHRTKLEKRHLYRLNSFENKAESLI